MRNPASFDSLFWKGFVAMRRGMYLDAIRAFRQAERIDARPAVLKTLAVSYYWAHQKKLFLLKMNEALKKDPGDFAPHYYLGRYYDSDVAEFARAAEYLRQAIERRPDHLESHYYLGHSYEAQQMPEQAEALYRKVLALKKADNLANQGLARLRLAAGKAEEALTFALTAKEAASNDPGPRKLLARVYADLGRDAAAAGEWKAAAELDPTDAVPLYRLYRAYAAMGRSTEADAVLAEYKKVAARWGSGN
jgi:tetratricopeptide (TPR) repeat protein